MTHEIASNKTAIILQAAAIVVVSALAGAALEYSGLLRTSVLGRLAATVGLPVVGLAIGLIGVAIAVATTMDSWSFRVRLNESALEIVDRGARSQVRYSNIAGLKLIPAYGAGIALKDKDEWLSAFAGSTASRDKVERISGVLAATYGCEIAFVNKRLRCGSKAFLEMLSQKSGIAVT